MQTRILAAASVAALAFGGGAALAATHGSSHQVAKRPATTRPVASNVHFPCRHHGGAASKTLAAQL